MAKIVKYDQDGNEVFFDHAIDARQAVESGQFFHTNPVEKTKSSGEVKPKEVNETKTSKGNKDSKG